MLKLGLHKTVTALKEERNEGIAARSCCHQLPGAEWLGTMQMAFLIALQGKVWHGSQLSPSASPASPCLLPWGSSPFTFRCICDPNSASLFAAPPAPFRFWGPAGVTPASDFRHLKTLDLAAPATPFCHPGWYSHVLGFVGKLGYTAYYSVLK